MKKFAFFLSFTLILSFTASAKAIKKYEEVIPLSPGVTLTKVQEFQTDRNLTYSYIKADLTAKNTEFKLFTSEEGTDVLDTVSNLVSGDEDVIGAINADFFSVFSGNKGFSLGLQIKDGDVVQSPINPSTMATVAYSDEEITMSYLDFHIMVVAPNWEYKEIRHLNKHTTYYGDILMYTSEWNDGMSPAPGGDVLEVVVSDGRIKEFRRNMPSVEIPKDGCVLVVSEGASMFFANNFKEGDEIKFDYYFTPDIQSAKYAFGGGAFLVQDGKAVPTFSHVVAGNHPRSAIGVNEDGTILYLLAVDGRQEMSKGLSMSRLAKLLIELGCHNAVNLDGGGSTNMVASTMWNKDIHSVNNPTENRKVINAIGLTYSAKGGSAAGIDIKADTDAVFIGHPVRISTALYDENLRPVDEKAKLSSVFGEIDGNVYTPDTEGETTVVAKQGKLSAETKIYVVESISGIDTDTYIRLEEGKSKTLNINVFDGFGHYVPVTDTRLFDITSSDEGVVTVEGNKIIAEEEGNAIVTIAKDGVFAHISVAIDSKDAAKPTEFIVPPDNVYYNTSADTEEKLFVGATFSEPDTLLEKLIDKKIKSALAEEENTVFLGDVAGFKSYEMANALCINIDTSKGSIRATDEEQWSKISESIENSGKENVFLFSEDSIFDGTDFTFRAVTDYLGETDKRIFVISRGEQNTYKYIKGVSYFTIGNNDKAKLGTEYLAYYKNLVFNIGDTVTFDWVPVYDGGEK